MTKQRQSLNQHQKEIQKKKLETESIMTKVDQELKPELEFVKQNELKVFNVQRIVGGGGLGLDQ